ncbi:hypothetical protein [Rhodococcus sp. X156]|uniref:hypothetical protein n=1 Tax=Rhodococcus sp. X156 TaxID=2499145 RepID=UPI000FDAA2C9|nr:hypothetical protein [Rhodococcus sp. X156]
MSTRAPRPPGRRPSGARPARRTAPPTAPDRVGLRTRLVAAPRRVRALGAAVVGLVYLGAVGLAASGGSWWVTLLCVLAGAAAGAVVVAAEPGQTQALAERLGWESGPGWLRAVQSDVDSGRLPRTDATERELARRYAWVRLEQRRPAQLLAAGLVAATVVYLLVVLLGGAVPGSAVPGLVVFPVGAAVVCGSTWRQHRTYARVLRVLGPDERTWELRRLRARTGADRA